MARLPARLDDVVGQDAEEPSGPGHAAGEGVRLLAGALADCGRPVEEPCARAVETLLPGPVDYDAVLLLVRTILLDAGQVAVWEFPADPAKVATVRAVTAWRLREWGLEELSFSTELIVSELFTNAIRYAGGPVLVRLIHDRGLVCEVCDTGHTSPHLRHAASDEEGGRGLCIVAQITRGWGTRYTETGKTIWAEQELPSAEAATGE